MTTTTSRFNKANNTNTNTQLKGNNTMNPIKSVLRDTWTIAGNLVNVVGTLSTTVTGELVKGTDLASSAIVATPKVIKELALSPVTATAAYQAEDQGISYEEAEEKLLESLPNTADEAVKGAVIQSSRLIAQLMKDDV